MYDEDGSYNEVISTPGTFQYPNPVQQLEQISNEQRTARVLATAYLDYEIIDGLTFSTNANVDWSDTQAESFNPSTVGVENLPPPVDPLATQVASSYLNWSSENTLTYENVIAEDHSINALAGFTMQRQDENFTALQGQEFAGDEVQTLNAASRIIVTGASEEDWSLMSFLARLNYDYKNRYLLTATIRQDGSSRFGRNSRWGTFPSAALGWRLSEEFFMSSLSNLDDLKLRASYGVTGNFSIGNYPYLGQVGIQNYILGGGLASGRSLNTLGNPNLGWERTHEYNIGLDASLFGSRVTFAANYYRSYTEDLLLNVQIPQSSGFSSVTENR